MNGISVFAGRGTREKTPPSVPSEGPARRWPSANQEEDPHQKQPRLAH